MMVDESHSRDEARRKRLPACGGDGAGTQTSVRSASQSTGMQGACMHNAHNARIWQRVQDQHV